MGNLTLGGALYPSAQKAQVYLKQSRGRKVVDTVKNWHSKESLILSYVCVYRNS